MNKKIVFALYTLIVVCIGFATVIEKYRGTEFVSEQIYGAWWFSALWAALTIAACAYILEQRLYKRAAVMLLHVSFVVILAGALTTHLFARRGTIRLRTDIPVISFVDKDNKVKSLPFSLTLKDFRIINYPGTDAPLDYQSIITSNDDTLIVSMNNIGHKNGYRLFQQSYDSDGKGVSLGVSYDPYGIAITYFGYLLLLIGIVATLLSRHTQMRTLYRKAVTAVLLLVSISASANHHPSPPRGGQGGLDKDIAHRMGTISVLYNNRICPLNTVATDFVYKLTGSASWQGYSADEIFVSWMIYYSPWEQQKLIRVKSREVQKLLGIDSQWASYSDFLNEYHEYKLQDAIDALRKGHGSVDKKGLMDADEKFHTVEMFYRGQFIRMFPYPISSPPRGGQGGLVNWYSPGAQTLPREIPVKEQFFIKQSMDYLTESIVTGQRDRAFEIIAKIKLFQRDMIGDLLPSETTTKTEIFYNAIRSQRWPVFLALTLSLLLCVVIPFLGKPSFTYHLLHITYHFSLIAYVSLLLGLRWWLSGHVPVSNGPETMLFMAWVLLILTCHPSSITYPPKGGRGASSSPIHHHLTLVTYHLSPPQGGDRGGSLGSLGASFCLLVAMLGGSSSQLTPLMPVLQSPLLSIHVMTVMCAYALFALQMLLGIQALFLLRKGNHSSSPIHHHLSPPRGGRGGVPTTHHPNGAGGASPSPIPPRGDRGATALSQLLLYPAVFLLTIGIFLGAVWANVSWGNYWSWDPKEAWALITLMVYAVPLHRSPLTTRQSPLYYHIYMVTAFLAVLITYFGVNYLLGGMHSYA